MFRIYECEISRKQELLKILEADPYAQDSFARVGYKIKDGSAVDEDREKTYVHISASEEFLKKADERLKDIAKPAPQQVQENIEKKIREEEDTVAAGVSMFD
ncbi:hypothetical protein JXA56_05770 [Candidatus Micrarchaeota archaeon]|nr:hypothetical protein [Candidatus Micrarchaeota archaeon]